MKRVIVEAELESTICLDKVDKRKVYIMEIHGDYYTACHSCSSYFFKNLNNSFTQHSESRSSLKELIKLCRNEVFEFDTFKEAAQAIIDGKI